jgi:hypothetical protein
MAAPIGRRIMLDRILQLLARVVEFLTKHVGK